MKVFRLLVLLIVALVLIGCGTTAEEPTTVIEPTEDVPVVEEDVAAPLSSAKVVFLFSYEEDFWATADEDAGAVEGLAEQGYIEGENLEIIRLYMNTKTVNKTGDQMEEITAEFLNQLEEIDPDLLLVMDDDALRHVGGKLLDSDLPIVFGGINGFPTDEGYGWLTDTDRGPLADSMEQPGHNITGVLERVSFKAGFELMQRILPEAETALFITDNSAVSNLLMSGGGGAGQLETVPLQITGQVYTDDYETLKSNVLESQSEVDAIVLFLPWTIVDADGNPVPQDQVVRWFLENSKLPSIGFLDILVEEGYLCGVVVDLNRQGYHAGVLGGRILNGESAADLPIIDPVANRILINLARADQLGIEIPFDVLEDADQVFQEMSVYPEYEMSK